MSVVARLVLLVAVWLLAWGRFDVVHVLVGLVLAVVLFVAFPMVPSGRRRIALSLRPVGVARLLWHVVVQLVRSNLLMTREIVSRRSRIHTGVIHYALESPSDLVLTLVANIIALSPGTMTVDATRDPRTISVHFLLLEDVSAAERSLAHLERLVAGAVRPSGASVR
ncbi:MAG TPA: Na+/H+ antiporter subunit E [Acidimicrobiales bacterium]|nr:Na+/H+ antiporter subunit E [Acidimicrobiales bacterium]